jgi:fumarylacetoacetate (FAA) hydrolase
MKLVSFIDRETAGERFGALLDDSIVDLGLASAAYLSLVAPDTVYDPRMLSSALGYLRGGDAAEAFVHDVLQWAEHHRDEAEVHRSLAETELLAPVPHPTSMRDGYAFRQHVEAARRNRGVEMIPEFDDFPIFYFTNHQAVTGPGEVEVMELHLNKLDFELECAIVIDREGRNISAAEADEYIAGYMVMNDWSARALQMDEMKLNLGPAKGKDFATSIGPFLVTRDELASRRIAGEHGERYDLTMTTRVNGTEVSRGNLKDMSWTFAQIIERASYGVTLYPGDVIGSGTVGTGCFLELNGSKITDNWWLKDGDLVECEIDLLGTLTNRVKRVG